MPVTCVTGMDCELIVCIHRQGVLDAPHVPPPPTSPGLSEDTPRLELPRSLRGFLLWRLGTAHRHGRGNQAHFFVPTRKLAMAAFANSWRRG